MTVDASRLDATNRERLRELRADLADADCVPAALAVEADFGDGGSLAVQREADRLREHVAAAAFLSATTLRVRVTDCADPGRTEPALRALRERCEREGLGVTFEGRAVPDALAT